MTSRCQPIGRKTLSIDAITKSILDDPNPSGQIIYDLAKRWRDDLVYVENYPEEGSLPDDGEVMVIFGVAIPMNCARVLLEPWIELTLKKKYGQIEYMDRRNLCEECMSCPCFAKKTTVRFIVDNIELDIKRAARHNFWWDYESMKQMWGTLSHQKKRTIRNDAEIQLKCAYYDCSSDKVDKCIDLPSCLEKFMDKQWDMSYYIDYDDLGF
jgi:hypothetical protein